MHSLQDIVSHVVSLVQGSGDHTVTGTQLRALLSFRFPDFLPAHYGCKNLRDFLVQHVPAVKEVARKGMDYVYGLAGSDRSVVVTATPGPSAQQAFPAGVGALAEASSVWRTFASPRTVYRLYGDPQSGRLVAVPPGGAPPESSWRMIPSCSAEKHVEIARTFVASLPSQSNRDLLTQFLTEWVGRPQWWVPFYNIIKQLGLASEWNQFRRQQISHQFKAALTEAGIPATSLPRMDVTERTAATGPPLRRSPSEEDAARLRKVAAAVVNRMSLTELRALTVKLGDVLDVLGS